jgi:hypothetical protein
MSDDDLLRLLRELREAFDDADAVAEDMLASPRRRELGPALHRRNYREAKRKLLDVLAEIARRLGGERGGGGGATAH